MRRFLFLLLCLMIYPTACGKEELKEKASRDLDVLTDSSNTSDFEVVEALTEPTIDEMLYGNKYCVHTVDEYGCATHVEIDGDAYKACRGELNGTSLLGVTINGTNYVSTVDETGNELSFRYSYEDFIDLYIDANALIIPELIDGYQLYDESEDTWTYLVETFNDWDEDKEYPNTTTITVSKTTRGIEEVSYNDGIETFIYIITPLNKHSWSVDDFLEAEYSDADLILWTDVSNAICHIKDEWDVYKYSVGNSANSSSKLSMEDSAYSEDNTESIF